MKKIDIFIAILIAFCWGSNYIAIKLAIHDAPAFFSTAIRFLCTAVILLPFLTKPNKNFADFYAISVVFGVFHIAVLYFAMRLGIDTSLSVILMQINIIFAVLIAKFALKEHFTLQVAIGVILAFIGMIIVVGSPKTLSNPIGVLLIIFSAFACAIFSILNRRLKNVPALSIVGWTNLISTPHLFLISYFFEGSPLEMVTGLSLKYWLSVGYSVVVSSIFGIALWVYLVQKYEIYKIVPFKLLVPFFGVSLSMVILKEKPELHVILGGVVTILGIAISNANLLKNFSWIQKKYESN